MIKWESKESNVTLRQDWDSWSVCCSCFVGRSRGRVPTISVPEATYSYLRRHFSSRVLLADMDSLF
jgi:hypothetical protein